jgi:usherin
MFNYILAPEGVDTPTLSIVSETAIRVSWMAPQTPNGDITGYNIYVNKEKTETGLVLPGSYIITGLQPYTVYEIQVLLLKQHASRFMLIFMKILNIF